MTALLELGAVLLALYLLECLALLPEGASLLVEGRRGRFRLARTSGALTLRGRRAWLAHPLPWRSALALAAPPAGDDDGGHDADTPPAAVLARLSELRRAGGSLRWLATALTVWLFAVAPLAVAAAGLAATWKPLAAGAVALVAAIAIAFAGAHRRLFPALADDRWAATAALALVPTDAMRAYASLGRPLLASVPPAVAVVALCGAPEAAERVARRLRELRWPTDAERAARTDAARERERLRLEALAAERGLELAGRLAAPALADDSAGYCPRCLVAYARLEASCADCPGVPVLARA
jgi:hypothetical protein